VLTVACTVDREMPNPWKVDAASGYGRSLVDQQMAMHEELIDRAQPLTTCHISDLSTERMRFRKHAQIWRPSFNEIRRRKLDDELLGELINNSKTYLNMTLDPHVVAFKKHRMKHKNFLPGKQERERQEQHANRHRRIMSGDGLVTRVDTTPPWVALRYGQFLRSSRYTKGGAPRAEVAARNKGPRRRTKPPPATEEFLKTFQRLPQRGVRGEPRQRGAQTVMGVGPREPQLHTIYAEHDEYGQDDYEDGGFE